MLRCLENGLYNKVHEWAIRLNKALYMTYQENTKQQEIVVELELVLSILHWYLAGMVISFVVFSLEVCVSKLEIWRKYQPRAVFNP